MSDTKRLIIDIGTNSVLALLAKVTDGNLSVIFDKKKTTKLGEGLISSGKLSKDAIVRTIDTVTMFVNDASYDEIYLIGTEALRAARNSDEFVKATKNAVGVETAIIDGNREAELSFLGSLYNLNIDKSDLLLIDVGGGSTELVRGKVRKIVSSISVPIGALKLREMSQADSLNAYETRAQSIIKVSIEHIQINASTIVIATGGTIASAATIDADLKNFDASRIHGAIIKKDHLAQLANRFESVSCPQRKALIAFDPERADIMLPGLGIYLAILGIINKDLVVVSIGGLRYGAALYPDKIWA